MENYDFDAIKKISLRYKKRNLTMRFLEYTHCAVGKTNDLSKLLFELAV